jgi:hypothetical protein
VLIVNAGLTGRTTNIDTAESRAALGTIVAPLKRVAAADVAPGVADLVFGTADAVAAFTLATVTVRHTR